MTMTLEELLDPRASALIVLDMQGFVCARSRRHPRQAFDRR
jgi:hypothetical protein